MDTSPRLFGLIWGKHFCLELFVRTLLLEHTAGFHISADGNPTYHGVETWLPDGDAATGCHERSQGGIWGPMDCLFCYSIVQC